MRGKGGVIPGPGVIGWFQPQVRMVIITAAFCFLTNVPVIFYTNAQFKTNVKLQTASVFTLLLSVGGGDELISAWCC